MRQARANPRECISELMARGLQQVATEKGGKKTAITIIKRNCQEKNTENKQVRKVTAEFTAGGGERSWR